MSFSISCLTKFLFHSASIDDTEKEEKKKSKKSKKKKATEEAAVVVENDVPSNTEGDSSLKSAKTYLTHNPAEARGQDSEQKKRSSRLWADYREI